MNEDTYEGQIDNPLTLNLYTYVENNPLTRIDPTGHCWICDEDTLKKIDEKVAQSHNQCLTASPTSYGGCIR